MPWNDLLLCENWSDYLKCYSCQGGVHKISTEDKEWSDYLKYHSCPRGCRRALLHRRAKCNETVAGALASRVLGSTGVKPFPELRSCDLCLVLTSLSFSDSSSTLLSVKLAHYTYLNCWFVCPPDPASTKVELFWGLRACLIYVWIPNTRRSAWKATDT